MPSKQLEQRQRKIMADIAKLGFCLPGSLVARTTRCGNPNCRCRTDPERLHGPYPTWTRKVAAKTVTRTLSATQVERYKPWFDNARRLRELIDELEALSVQAAGEAEGWDHHMKDQQPTTAHG
jgi:hypothetical protein